MFSVHCIGSVGARNGLGYGYRYDIVWDCMRHIWIEHTGHEHGNGHC
jgi:hypothetical protein